MIYNKLPVILKRYSFNSKMEICQVNSLRISDFTGIKVNEIINDLDCANCAREIEKINLYNFLLQYNSYSSLL